MGGYDGASRAFIRRYDGVSYELTTPVEVFSGERSEKVTALWDTGANSSCISKRLASMLRPTESGGYVLNTAGGSVITHKYQVDLLLPNNVRITNLEVYDSDISSQGVDMLVGMDVISLGDFTVNCYEGKTSFTFRIPSTLRTNYVSSSEML